MDGAGDRAGAPETIPIPMKIRLLPDSICYSIKRNTRQGFSVLLLGGCLALAGAPGATNEVVYHNGVSSLRVHVNPGVEFGDEIFLASGTNAVLECTITTFCFEYAGTGFQGNERARIRFYRNDGAPQGGGSRAPGTLLFDSQPFLIAEAPGGAAYTLRRLSVPHVPGHFTWTAEIYASPAVSAGLSLYGPPAVGNNFNDYWERSGTNWALKTHPYYPMSFGAVIEATDVVTEENRPVTLQMLGFEAGKLKLCMHTPANHHCMIEESFDLIHWKCVCDKMTVSGETIGYDDDAAMHTQAFYRVMVCH